MHTGIVRIDYAAIGGMASLNMSIARMRRKHYRNIVKK